MCKKLLVIAAVMLFGLAGSSNGVVPPPWDYTYEGDVLPDAASPAWTHGKAEGASFIDDSALTMLDAESWDIYDVGLKDIDPVNFLWDNPDTPEADWTAQFGKCFTIEWRMNIIYVPSGVLPKDSQVGLKLEYAIYPPGTCRTVKQEWYYDVDNKRVVNNQYKDTNFQHEGKDAEGNYNPNLLDGFTGIDLGEWHTYYLTSYRVDGGYHRELWLDGEYIGRWWTEKRRDGESGVIKMRAYKDLFPSSYVLFDYVRWCDEPYGKYAIPEPATVLLLGLGGLALIRKRK